MAQATIEAYTSGGTTLIYGKDCPGEFVLRKLDHWGYPVSQIHVGLRGWVGRVGICEANPSEILDDAAFAASQTHGVTGVETTLSVREPGQLQFTERAILHGLGYMTN